MAPLADTAIVKLRPANLLAIAVLAVPAWGLNPRLALTQLGHDIWTTSSGLPRDSIRAIAQTPDGYLWFATTGGLARFDGVSFTVFSGANTPILGEGLISAMWAAPDGSLWIGIVHNGLLRFRNGRFEKFEGNLGVSGDFIRALRTDSRGVLWIGADKGLARLEHGRATTVFAGGWEANVHVLLEYPAGTVWVGANNGLHRFEGGGERVFTTKDGLLDNSIWGLAVGQGGALTVGTHTGGLSELRQGRFRTLGPRDSFTSSGILALLADRDGALWVGTDGGGVKRWAEGKFSSFQTRDGLSNQVVRCLFEDAEGSVWMGTAGGGINRFKEYRATMRTMREGLPSDSVRTVQQDHSGDIWMGTPNGIARLEGWALQPLDVARNPRPPEQRVGGFRRRSRAQVSRGAESPNPTFVELSASYPSAVRATQWHGLGRFGRQPHRFSGRFDGGLRQATGPGRRAGDGPRRGP